MNKSITEFLYIRCTFVFKTVQFLYIPGMYKNTVPVHFVHISCTMYKNIIENKLFSVQCTSFSVHFLNYSTRALFVQLFWLYTFFVHNKMYRNHFWGPRKIKKEGAPKLNGPQWVKRCCRTISGRGHWSRAVYPDGTRGNAATSKAGPKSSCGRLLAL